MNYITFRWIRGISYLGHPKFSEKLIENHYNDFIMGPMASQITSLTFVYTAVYSGADQRKHQTLRHWPLCGDFTGDRWISRTKDQKRGKCFHLMTSSCQVTCFYKPLAVFGWPEVWEILGCSLVIRHAKNHAVSHAGSCCRYSAPRSSVVQFHPGCPRRIPLCGWQQPTRFKIWLYYTSRTTVKHVWNDHLYNKI